MWAQMRAWLVERAIAAAERALLDAYAQQRAWLEVQAIARERGETVQERPEAHRARPTH
jgi:hypothetical protein